MRKFRRRDLELETAITPLSIGGESLGPGESQKTIKGKTKNVSAGGAMVEVAYDIGKSSYMLIQLHIDKDDFPGLLLGQMIWTLSDDEKGGTTKSGVKFLTEEELAALKEEDESIDLPPEIIGFDEKRREALDELLGDILGSSDE